MEEKKKSKKTLIIVIILLIILIGAVGGYFGYKYWENNKSVGTEWGDTYYNYLNEKIEQGEYNDAENEKLQFIQLEENKMPSMVLSYENENKKIIEISVINAENVVKTKQYQVEDNTELNVEMLYDIETKEYNWYEHEKKEDGTEIFTQVSQSDIEEGTEKNDIEETGANNIEEGTQPTEDKKHEFTKEDMTGKEVAEGEIPSIPKFDEEFVKPDVDKKEFDVDLNQEMEEKDFKEKVTEAVEDYKSQDQTITEETKEKTEEKLNELETKKEEIKKAEEEARKKAEEEAKKGLKVGNYTLKYGRYKIVEYDGEHDETYTIKQDGTFTYKKNWENAKNEKYTDTANGTYRVYFDNGNEYDSTKSWIIEFKYTSYNSTYTPRNSMPFDYAYFDVVENNSFQYRQSDGKFIYKGE